MIKVYLDWNIMSGLKNAYFPELKVILDNKGKFLLVYSTAHIGDLIASVIDGDAEQDHRIREDLEYISTLTANRCMAVSSKELQLDYHDPIDLFEEQRRTNLIFDDFSIEGLLKSSTDGIEDGPIKDAITLAFKTIQNMPLDPIFVKALAEDENSDLNRMFPGLRDDPTMGGFFKSFGAMYKNLNESTGYKDLRETVQKVGVNSGHFNPGTNPFEIVEAIYCKMGMQPRQFHETGKHVPAWYDDITNEYVLLDMHGYKADKVKVTPKNKSTFRNTTDDASHAAFASRCEIYITNDDRNYHKTIAVYDKLEVGTLVLKPEEFLEYYNKFLNHHTIEEHYGSVKARLAVPEGWEEICLEDNVRFGFERFCGEYFFNFFNKITLPEREQFIVLTKLHTTDRNYFVSYDEVNAVIRSLSSVLGMDVEGKGEAVKGEIDVDWEGRSWKANIGDIVLRRRNTFFQLYLYTHDRYRIESYEDEFSSDENTSKRKIRSFFDRILKFGKHRK